MNKSELSVTLIQMAIDWEDPTKNMAVLTQKIGSLGNPTDLIVLPEMFTTGFSMNPETIAETMDGPTIQWMRAVAATYQTAIAGSVIIQDEGNYFNRFIMAHVDGKVEHYDKKHLFTLAGEHKIYSEGNILKTFELKGWKIRPMVCYDLRFPVWARNTDDYDLLIYVANWPSPRKIAWDTLLQARSIENMCYTIGVNRVGKDANGLEYPGHSSVFDSLGAICLDFDEGKEAIGQVTLSKDHLSTTRSKLNFLNDRDSFSIDI